jgi:hypothetical protein
MPRLISVLNESISRIEVLLALNSVVFFRDFHGFEFNTKLLSISVSRGEFYRRLEYFGIK